MTKAPKGGRYWMGFFSGFSASLVVCWAIYQFFLADDPRVERLNEQLTECEKVTNVLKDSVAALSSLGTELGRFQIPTAHDEYGIPIWGNQIIGDISATGCPDYIDIDLHIDTCKGRLAEDNTRVFRRACEERHSFRIRNGNYAPIGLINERYLIQFVGMTDTVAVVRLLRVPGSW